MTPRGYRRNELLHLLKTEFLVRHFAPAKLQSDFHLHVFAQEIDGMAQLHAKIMRIDLRTELHLFDLIRVLMLLRFLVLLRLLVAKFAVIDDAANRRRGVGSDLHQINSEGLRLANRVSQLQDSELLAVGAYDTHFAGTDFPVNSNLWSTGPGGTRRKRAAQDALLWRMFMQI
jgi:hypothetical protein